MKNIPVIERVLSKVEKIPECGCWIFMGAVNEAGYGMVGLGGRGSGIDRAHRVTYRHFVSDIPEGLVVCHKCDVRSCCNPDHLFLGTHADNHADMVKKGRDSKPPRNSGDEWRKKLSIAKIGNKICVGRKPWNKGIKCQNISSGKKAAWAKIKAAK